MDELPAPIQRIVDQATMPRGTQPARHSIDFDFDMEPGVVTVARLQATSALPVPVRGQHITVHGSWVRVVDVDTSYETDETGGVIVHTAVRITPGE